ncbi:MAG: phosphoenolpyruvate carboxykinase domain-containing protein [Oscillospiraceae bacterium]|nr:phosphoenolpyruvate carboxykinase domain-containing protein [Oscillospiraceae bacterium]
MITNSAVLKRIDEIRSLANPEKEIWIDGSEEQIGVLKAAALDLELVTPLCDERFPGCVLHRTSIGGAARADTRLFICCENRADADPDANWQEPSQMYETLREKFTNFFAGKTMYIVPFCLGDRAGVQITDNLCVVLNMVTINICGTSAAKMLNALSKGAAKAQEGEIPDWFFGVHGSGTDTVPKEDNRYICNFPQDNAVWAINTGFGANAVLSKEAFALRLASCAAQREGWLAEHMAILEVITPDSDEPFYIAAAFPQGCGKTSLAMLEVCPEYAQRGYAVRCIGDDVAWLKKGSDGRLWATNPEIGVFGLASGLNEESNPNVFATFSENAIFANVVHNTDNNTVWWEGMASLDKSELTDESLINWKGEYWTAPDEPPPVLVSTSADDDFADEDDEDDPDSEFAEGYVPEEPGEEFAIDAPTSDFDEAGENADASDVPDSEGCAGETLYGSKVPSRGSHSNSRVTAPLINCPNLSESWNNPDGVPISAIIFGGRRSKAVPLVYQTFDWEHGVFVGAILGSETGIGGSTVVRRNPMAMLSLCGYNTTDYWRHWLKLGKKLGRNAPKIFNVNWFKVGDGGILWPGFGENIRVLDWVINRVTKTGDERPGSIEAPMGYLPKLEDIDISGLEEQYGFTAETLERVFRLEKNHWKEDINAVKQFFAKFGDKIPEQLRDQLMDFEKRLLNS